MYLFNRSSLIFFLFKRFARFLSFFCDPTFSKWLPFYFFIFLLLLSRNNGKLTQNCSIRHVAFSFTFTRNWAKIKKRSTHINQLHKCVPFSLQQHLNLNGKPFHLYRLTHTNTRMNSVRHFAVTLMNN